jgi:hypothetical protein
MTGMGLLTAVAVALLGVASSPYVSVTAEFVPASKPGGEAHVAVTFAPRDKDVVVNEEPGPRLKLEADEAVLVDKQKPAGRAVYDPENPKYLDVAIPVHLPVAVKPSAPKGRHDVKAKLTYFYCSKREGWCRKGTEDLEFQVRVP